MPSFSSVLLFASALPALLSASPIKARQDTVCPVTTAGDYIFEIDNVFIRKLDGVNVSSFGFDILATNGGTLDFTCTPTDVTTGLTVTTGIEDSKLYSCGPNTFFTFALQKDRSGLLLKQDVSDTVKLVGTATLPTYCRAGGSGANDQVCNGVSPAYITMVQDV